MTVLWLAFGIYIAGVAAVLFLRPSSMFRPGSGTWKEFGLATTGNYSIFPFWMFVLVWAIASYAIASIISFFLANLVMQSSPNHVSSMAMTPISSSPPNVMPQHNILQENLSTPVPQTVSSTSSFNLATPSRVPGYYVLDTPSTGAPRYVYYGTEPPKL